MADYCTTADCIDPAVTANQDNVNSGNVQVDSILRKMGIDPAIVPLPNAILTQMAVAASLRVACVQQALGEDSTLIRKAREYERTIELLEAGLNRAALGIAEDVSGGSYGSVILRRG